MNRDPLIPMIAVVTDIRVDTPDVKTFRVVGLDGRKPFSHIPGQCAMLSVPGVGEALFSITSSPTDLDFLEFSIKKCGCVTEWLHAMEPGQQVTLRGSLWQRLPGGYGLPGEGFGVHCRRHRPGAAAVCDPLCAGPTGPGTGRWTLSMAPAPGTTWWTIRRLWSSGARRRA